MGIIQTFTTDLPDVVKSVDYDSNTRLSVNLTTGVVGSSSSTISAIIADQKRDESGNLLTVVISGDDATIEVGNMIELDSNKYQASDVQKAVLEGETLYICTFGQIT